MFAVLLLCVLTLRPVFSDIRYIPYGAHEWASGPRCRDSGQDCQFVGNHSWNLEFRVHGQNIVTYHEEDFIRVTCSNRTAVLVPSSLPSFISERKLKTLILEDCSLPDDGYGYFQGILAALNVTLECEGLPCGLQLLLPHPAQLKAGHLAGLDALGNLELNARISPSSVTASTSSDFLSSVPNLTRLHVNQVKLGPGSMDHPPLGLEDLSLKHTTLDHLTKDLLSLTKLNYLYVMDRTVNLTVDSFVNRAPNLGLVALEVLSVFVDLDSVVTPSLIELILMQWVPKNLKVMTRCNSLETLRLLSPQVETLPSRFVSSCPNLQTLILYFRGSELRVLPREFLVNTKELTKLVIMFGQLEVLPDDLFRYSPKLAVLNLSGNSITTLTSTMFSSLTSLRSLNLSGNKLKMVSMASLIAPALRGLTKLDLDQNPDLQDLCKPNQDRELQYITEDNRIWVCSLQERAQEYPL